MVGFDIDFGTYFSLLMVNHDIMGLYVPVHYALAVAIVQRLQQLIDVISNVVVLELGVQTPEIGVVDIFKYQRGCFTLVHSI